MVRPKKRRRSPLKAELCFDARGPEHTREQSRTITSRLFNCMSPNRFPVKHWPGLNPSCEQITQEEPSSCPTPDCRVSQNLSLLVHSANKDRRHFSVLQRIFGLSNVGWSSHRPSAIRRACSLTTR